MEPRPDDGTHRAGGRWWTPPGYFDAVAGLPPSAECRRWLALAEESGWADPAGRHQPARRSGAVLWQARVRLASLLGCLPGEVWFAPNADIGLCTAARAIADSRPGAPVITSPLERLSLLRAFDEHLGGRPPRTLRVGPTGRIDADDPILGEPAALLAVQWANREIGTIQDLASIARAKHPSTPLLVDATALRHQADVPAHYDALVLDPAAWGGPQGIAVLACRTSVPWSAQAPATPADRFPGRAPVALAAAAAMTLPSSADARQREDSVGLMAQRLALRLCEEIDGCTVLGGPRLPHLVPLSLAYVNAEQLVDALSALGFAVHSGSACTSDTRRPSHVLTAIGAMTHGNLRISLPPDCGDTDVDTLADAIIRLVAEQRREAGLA